MNDLLASASEGKDIKYQEYLDCFELARSVGKEFPTDDDIPPVIDDPHFIIGWKTTKRFWSDVDNGFVDNPHKATLFTKNEGIFRVGKWVIENVNQWPVQLIDIDEFNESKVQLNTVVVRKDGSPMIVVVIPKRLNKFIKLIGKDTEITCSFEEYVHYIRQGTFRVIWDPHLCRSLSSSDITSYLNSIGSQE